MLRNMKLYFEFVLLCLVLTACSTQPSTLPSTPTLTPATTQTPTDLVFTETSILPSPTPLSIATPVALECATLFEQRELEEPYQRDKNTNQPRYTLSTEELNSYLALMGVESLCVPLQVGAPFTNVDWDSQQLGGTTGRMLSIGFEELYYGEGWSEGHIVYATYDFAAPTMYDIFATLEDRDAVAQGTMLDMLEVDGVKGFMRFKLGTSMGTQPVYKTYVFPFETYYIAVVYDLGAYDPGDVEAVIQKLKAGEYPADRLQDIQALDSLALSMQFQLSSHASAPTAMTSSTTYRDSRLGITFDYPSGWHLQDAPAEPVDVLLSYEPASSPHKLEWDATTVSIGVRAAPAELTSDSLDTWVENTKQEAIAAQLTVFAEERLTLATGLLAARITVVSGSGGMVEYVLVALDGHPFEIVVQGNFALARAVLDTLRSPQ